MPCKRFGDDALIALDHWERFNSVGAQEAFREYNPVPVGLNYKLADKQELDRVLTNFTDAGDQVHIGWFDGRFGATIYKHNSAGSICFVKLLARRQGRGDPTGLEGMDLLLPLGTPLTPLLGRLSPLGFACGVVNNDAHTWLEVKDADGFEFKFADHTVWEVCIKEMQAIKQPQAV
jgi:hypothetical protein